MVSFRDLVESMERDILEKEYSVVNYGKETCPPNTSNVPRSCRQEQIRKWKNNAFPQVLKDVRKDHLEADKNTINDLESEKRSQSTNTHDESMDDRRKSEETVMCDGKRTWGHKGAVLEGTGRETEPPSHARNEYVADEILKHEYRQLPLAAQGRLDDEHSLPVKIEDGECELQDQDDQHTVANEREFANADQQFVSHQREFSNVNQEFMAHEYLYEHTSGEVLRSEHYPQRGCVVKEEEKCCTVIKEEKMDDSDTVAESVEHDATRLPPLDPTESVWIQVAHTKRYQESNLLTPHRPGMAYSKHQTTYATGPNHLGRSSTNSIASASTVAHSPSVPRADTRGTRNLTRTSNNASSTRHANVSNTTGHRGDTERAVRDGSRAGGGRGRWWLGGGNPCDTSGAQRSRHTSGRSSQEPCVSASSDGGFGTASVWGVTGLLSHTTQTTRGWRHLVPLRNCRGVKASPSTHNIRWCDPGDAGSTTAGVGSRYAGVEAGHTLGVPGPHHLTTHDTNDLSKKHRSRHSRGSKTSNMNEAGGLERQGSDAAAAAAAEHGSSADTPVPNPPQPSSTFRCDVCEATRRDAESLARHWRLHAPARPFACPDCPSRFNQLVHLQIHRRTHTGEKPFRCGTCGFRFSRKDRLRCHERSHSGERPYPCPDCEATFRDVASLKVHLATHAHHTPYTCRICHATFAQLSTFTSHWRRHSWGDNLHENT